MIKYAVRVLAISVLVHGNVILPTRLVHAVPIGVSVAGLSLANVYLTHASEEKDTDVLDKETRVKRAALLGLGATGFVTKRLHGRLPATRLARAVAACNSTSVDRRLLLGIQGLRSRGLDVIKANIKQHYSRYSYPLIECCDDLEKAEDMLGDAKWSLRDAQHDFGQDGNIEQQDRCKALISEIGERRSNIAFLSRFITYTCESRFAAEIDRYRELKRKRKNEPWLKRLHDYCAQVVHTVSSFGKK